MVVDPPFKIVPHIGPIVPPVPKVIELDCITPGRQLSAGELPVTQAKVYPFGIHTILALAQVVPVA
jgi:hypothetical protein